MYDLRKLTIKGGGEEGYRKNIPSIYPPPFLEKAKYELFREI